jgi:cytoskeletal protein RodZ
MSAAGNSHIKTGVQPSATRSDKDSKVRTLKEPPDIWELVHETRADFKPGSAFVGHLKSLKTLVLFVFLLVVGGGGVFGVMKFRVWSEGRATAPPVPAETSKSVLSPSSPLPNQTSADQSTNKAPSPTEPAASTVDEPETAPAVPAASSETKVSAASSDSKGLVKPRPQDSTNSTRATGESVATRNKEKARASKLTAAASPTTVRTDNKDGNQAGPTPAPKSDKPQAANPTVTKRETDKAQSPQLIAPAKSSATPKPKVIPWP